MNAQEFDNTEPGDTVWMQTGIFTASRVLILAKGGQGATRRAWVRVLDRHPEQADTATINQGRGLPVSYKSLFLMDGGW